MQVALFVGVEISVEHFPVEQVPQETYPPQPSLTLPQAIP